MRPHQPSYQRELRVYSSAACHDIRLQSDDLRHSHAADCPRRGLADVHAVHYRAGDCGGVLRVPGAVDWDKGESWVL